MTNDLPPALVLVSILLFSSPSVVGSNHFDDPIIIAVDLDNGIVTDQDIFVSGYVENEDLPSSIWWHLSDSEGRVEHGTLTGELFELDRLSSRPRWGFEFTIEARGAMPCACNLHIFAQDSVSDPIEVIRSIFFHEGAHSLPTTVYIESPTEDSWASSTLQIEGHSFSMGDSVPTLLAKIVQSTPSVQCSERESSLILDSVGDSAIILPVDAVWGSFVSEIDVSGYDDGWHDIFVFSSNEDVAGYSEACVSVRVDNTPPDVTIGGPSSAIEGSGNLLFDGSETDDAHWGRDGINYIWTIRRPSHTGSIPIEVLSGHDLRSYSFSTDYSGEFELSLTAIDLAGNSETSMIHFTIENLAPVIRLEIDGRAVFDGDTVYLQKSSAIEFDATSSSDTDNDISSLRCVWKINNIPIYEGRYREMPWPEGVGDQYALTLEVSDDDRETSVLTVIISDADPSSPIPPSMVILLCSTAFLIFAVFKRRLTATKDIQIPKWT
ncbi:MAG: hypothetical protein CMB35_03320 [Euryarchaeota archaeon]|nr:hypothetical protein [Euryarchaeota archaeon]